MVQDTWQFMSCKLISQQVWQHNSRDDLELSIYVLLWVTLMYLTCSNVSQVTLFMKGVLNPQYHENRGGLNKADFLQGRTFLEAVDFPNQHNPHNLIDQLARNLALIHKKFSKSC